MKINRRDFFARSSDLILGLLPFLNLNVNEITVRHFYGDNNKLLSSDGNVLIIIHLAGGNDWFNTIIPYSNTEYYRSRPNLAIVKEELLYLNKNFAFNPFMQDMKAIYDKKQMAILLNCGFAESSLSHDTANKQWQCLSAKSEQIWLGRYANYIESKELSGTSFSAISVEPHFYLDNNLAGKVRLKEKVNYSLLQKENGFAFNMDSHYVINNVEDDLSKYVEDGFIQAMDKVAHSIASENHISIYRISLGGFDTHQNQMPQHNLLLQILSRGMKSFQDHLDKLGIADKVLTIITSEFGRSLKENDQLGTDHEQMNNMLVIGKMVKGGFYPNEDASINPYSVYATLFDNWFSCSSEQVLGSKYATVTFI